RGGGPPRSWRPPPGESLTPRGFPPGTGPPPPMGRSPRRPHDSRFGDALRHNRHVPLRVLLVAILVGAAVLAVGCGSSEGGDSPKAPLAFCKAASRYDDRLSRGAKLGEQVRLVPGLDEAGPRRDTPP